MTEKLPTSYYVEHIHEGHRVARATRHLKKAELVDCPNLCGEQHYLGAIPDRCKNRGKPGPARKPRNPNEYNQE